MPFWPRFYNQTVIRSCPRFGVGSMGEEKNWIANMELDNEGQEGVLVVLYTVDGNQKSGINSPVEVGS